MSEFCFGVVVGGGVVLTVKMFASAGLLPATVVVCVREAEGRPNMSYHDRLHAWLALAVGVYSTV